MARRAACTPPRRAVAWCVRGAEVAEAARDRLVDAIANGGDSFAAVREKLAAVEQEVAAANADLERAMFAKRAVRTPTTIDPRALRSYLRDLRRTIRKDIPAAKAAVANLLDGDMVLVPAADGQPAYVKGRVSLAVVIGAGQSNARSRSSRGLARPQMHGGVAPPGTPRFRHARDERRRRQTCVVGECTA
jgi:hypothetical protein